MLPPIGWCRRERSYHHAQVDRLRPQLFEQRDFCVACHVAGTDACRLFGPSAAAPAEVPADFGHGGTAGRLLGQALTIEEHTDLYHVRVHPTGVLYDPASSSIFSRPVRIGCAGCRGDGRLYARHAHATCDHVRRPTGRGMLLDVLNGQQRGNAARRCRGNGHPARAGHRTLGAPHADGRCWPDVRGRRLVLWCSGGRDWMRLLRRHDGQPQARTEVALLPGVAPSGARWRRQQTGGLGRRPACP